MTGKAVPVVFFPRFTALVGSPQSYYTNAIGVAEYTGAQLTAWRGAFTGTGTSLTLVFQESTDRVTWSECDGDNHVQPPASQEQDITVVFSKRWMRVGCLLDGTDGGVTLWLQGVLLAREK